jgi:uncharacterized membrane protein (DUF4010 family)
LTTGTFTFFLWKKASKIKAKLHLESPFTLGPALKFGFFFALILALVKIADYYLHSRGIYLVSFVSGFADVDAITLSLSQLAKDNALLEIAKRGIVIAVLTNVAVKAGIAYWFGGKEFGKIILGFFVGLIALGFLLLWLI